MKKILYYEHWKFSPFVLKYVYVVRWRPDKENKQFIFEVIKC